VEYVVYDTNIASLAVRGQLPASLAARLPGAVPVLSFVTVGELGKWAEVRAWGARSRGALDRWISQRPVIDSDQNVSRIWGRLAAAAQLRGAWRSDNDLWVAACCISQGLPLVTRNVKDFVAVVENHGLTLITE
jgi:toxin FitB